MTVIRPLGLTMSGSGTQVLSGSNTYSGPTTVNAGTPMAAGGWRAHAQLGLHDQRRHARCHGLCQTVQSLAVGASGTLNLSIGDPLDKQRFGQPGRHAQSLRR